MFQEDPNGPNKMDSRGLNVTSTTSKNADKFSSRRNTGHPRGGQNYNFEAQSYPEPRKNRGKNKNRTNNYQKQHQLPHQQRQQDFPPKNNAQQFGAAACASKVEYEDEFEVGSVFNAGSKKQSLNHLLNFQFEPRSGSGSSNSRTKHHGKNRQRNVSTKTKYNKEQYLQANCQFVVKADGDYTIHLTEPDVIVQWEQIEQIVLKTTSTVPSCPICLYPPKAAKITRCGHVFCWPCILHYLSLSDHAWRKCPICYEAIHRPDLKSVVSVTWDEFNINDEIEFRLMRRDRNSLFALPVEDYFPEVNDKHPGFNDKYTSHSQLVLATPSQVVKGIIAKERFELEEQYRAEKDEPEACFIEEALQYLSQREAGIDISHFQEAIAEDVETEDDVRSSDSSENTPPTFGLEDFKEEDEFEGRPRHASSSSDGTVESTEIIEDEMVTVEDLDISTIQPALMKKKATPKDVFYFYQSSDGQPIFLHALNVQMLVQEYGTLENCPSRIQGKIMEKDNTSMTEDLRNRLRYLRHLPVTSIFEVCEVQMKPPLISKETIAEFSAQLESRRRKRNRRAREERRREKVIQAEENKRMGKYPDMKYRIESAYHFPQVSGDNLTSARSTESLVSVDSTLSTSPYPGTSVGDSTDGAGFSFARMLKEGAAKPSAAMALPRSETFPALTPISVKKHDDSEPETMPEEYVPPPPKASFGDALAHAFEQATTISGNKNTTNSTKGKKKKMKGQKISLTGNFRPLRD